MSSLTDSAPAPAWSGNPIAAGAPGTAGTLDSSVQPSPSQQTEIENWEGEGGSVPSTPGTASADEQRGALHGIDATTRMDRLPARLLL